MVVELSTTTFCTPYFAAYSRMLLVPTTLKLWCSLGSSRGSCMIAMCRSALISPLRKTSSTFFLRRSSWWSSTSFGLPTKGRRSRPATCSVRCNSRAIVRPRLPLIPLMRMVSLAIRVHSKRSAAAYRRRLEEDSLSLFDTPVEHCLDARLHLGDLAHQLGVLVVRAGREAHRRPEVEAVLHRQWKRQQGRRHREGREAEDLRRALEVPQRRRLLLGSDQRDGHDGRLHLQRQPHEPGAELLQLVLLLEGLVESARTFREDHQRLAGREQAARILGSADHLPDAREERRDERQRRRPLLHHGSADARRLRLEQHGEADHQGVERKLARM